MIFIGERINAGFKDIRAAIENKDAEAIKQWAVKQTKAGATYLDVNMGTASNKAEDLCWMIENVQEVVDTPISIDNNKPALLKEAMKACKKPPLINSLTGSDVLAEDQLFATLDPTMRAVTLPGGTEIVLSDTVGFISDLPTQLVAAFRATLEEVTGADIIVHVRDMSNPRVSRTASVVRGSNPNDLIRRGPHLAREPQLHGHRHVLR